MKKSNQPKQIVISDQTDQPETETAPPFSIVSLRERLLADVRTHLNAIWEDIGDDGKHDLLALENIFGSLFDVLEVTEKTLEEAAPVLQSQQIAVRMMKQQRDDALAELEGIVRAIDDLDVTNPKVRQVYQAILAQLQVVKAAV